MTYLQGDNLFINLNFFGHKIRPYCCLVLLSEFLVYISAMPVKATKRDYFSESIYVIEKVRKTQKSNIRDPTCRGY